MPPGQVALEIARHAPERVVAEPLSANVNASSSPAKRRLRAVALVHVEIDHQHAPQPARSRRLAGRRHDVVEDAEAAPHVRERVVRAAAEVRARAVGERGIGRLERGPDRAPRAFDQLGRPGQPERPLLVARELAALDALDPVGGVREQDLLARRRTRVVHLEARIRRSTRARSSAYLPSGKRCPSGSG